MSAQVTIEHVDKIIKKTKAKKSSRKSRHHKHYDIIKDGIIVLTFGVSHTPKKGKPQSHLPGQLFLSTSQTKQFAECNITLTQYFKILITLGIIEPSSD